MRFPLALLLLLGFCLSAVAAPLSNQLKNHPSPYLALHGTDPTAWQEWNAETVARAKREGKLLLLSIGAVFLRKRIFLLVRYIREPLLLAYSTASSEAALPKLFEQLDRFGVPRRVSGFMLPLGYSFNLDGSMMYLSFATVFIAQAYGIHMSLESQVLMLLTLMVTSKGIAGVPRASIVVIAATLTQFGLPVEGIALILGIDQFLDMGRTATNVVGNAVATSVITQWEGMLQPPMDPDAEPLHAPSHTIAHGRSGLNVDPDQ